jgi:histidine ammonia-lyase
VDAVVLGGRDLTLEAFEDVCLRGRPVALGDAAAAAVRNSRTTVEAILERGEVVYGINTGFGHLANVRIDASDLVALQHNLLRSHAVGVGEPFDVPTTRGIVLLRAAVLAAGHSGVRLVVLQQLLDLLNRGIHPVIPKQGSVGASGDLAPLAHLALVLVGEGFVHGEDGLPEPAANALARHGLTPLGLQAKEGLALINGTQAMTSLGSLVVQRARRLAKVADVIGATTVEAKLGSHTPFDERLHALRPHPGQIAAAANFRQLLVGGDLAASHADCDKVQDAYSLRCMPQVHGAARAAIEHAAAVLERELCSVTDNPTVFLEGDLLSGGNFHGQPVAMALDYLAMGLSELGSIAERRIEQLVNPRLSELPAFLIEDSGLHSGFMMAQVTAAALASENKGLCHPASTDSIPTSANQEDHVSMGPIAARQANRVLHNVEAILGIELLVAGQGLDFRQPLVPADGPRAAYAALRHRVAPLTEDRYLAADLAAAADLVRDGLLDAVEAVVGPLA